jgi:N-acetylmuramoyl-L-alanine amidase
VTYPANGAPTGRSVFVDPGHGGPDPGAVGAAGGTQVIEKVVALAVAKRVTGLLQNGGYRVIMSRTGDSSVASLPSNTALSPDDIRSDLLARIACANRSGADVLLSIHFNGVDDASVSGSETFYDAIRPFAANNHRLAIDLERSITTAIGSTNLGVWPDDQNVGPALSPAGSVYGHLIVLGPPSPGYVDTPSEMPGALVEPLFLSNRMDAQKAADPRIQEQIAVAIDAGVVAYFGGA